VATAIAPPETDHAHQPIRDPVTFEEAALLFMETEQPEFQNVSVRSLAVRLRRWAEADGLPMEYRGRKLVVSKSNLLVAHATRYPAAGGR
jgi:hypothetical protein